MPRACTVCGHPRRSDIDKALIEGQSNRGIARSFGLSDHAVGRHAKSHLPQTLAETVAVLGPAIQSQQSRHPQTLPVTAVVDRLGDSIDIIGEITRQLARVNRLSDAVHEWLQDPLNPDVYDIGPRGDEITVIYVEPGDGLPVRGKATLQELINRVEASRDLMVLSTTSKHADPRKLLLDAAAGLKEHLHLLTSILDKLHSAEQAQRFEAAVLAAIGEASPDVRSRIEHTLRHSQALRQLAGRP